MTIRIRWLGSVRYRDAHALQTALHGSSAADYLLLLEHPHVYTLGARGKDSHMLVDPTTVDAELVRADRGGDVTYHGPGQLVGYPIVDVDPPHRCGVSGTVSFTRVLEQVVIDALGAVGLAHATRVRGYPGVWIAGVDGRKRKIAAVGVKIRQGRSMHGFALNVDPDLAMFDHIVPCGIQGMGVTSLARELVDRGMSPAGMRSAVDAVAAVAAQRWGQREIPDYAGLPWRSPMSATETSSVPGAALSGLRSDAMVSSQTVHVSGRLGARLSEAGILTDAINDRGRPTVKIRRHMTTRYAETERIVKTLALSTVCEEAGCPNIYECWADGTATFMLAGSRCTRRCGFCQVDTSKPLALDPDEPQRVAAAVERMGLSFAVLTMVARDDLSDGGAAHVASTIDAIRGRTPDVGVEALISDVKGDPDALQAIFAAKPDVLNHNIESVVRLQRAVRPNASYARSLAVLGRAKAAGLTTKTSIIVGMGETNEEVSQLMDDLRAVGVDIVTIGQYLQPSRSHIPVERWVPEEQFAAWTRAGLDLGFAHVEASPLTRSSYHARQAAARTLH